MASWDAVELKAKQRNTGTQWGCVCVCGGAGRDGVTHMFWDTWRCINQRAGESHLRRTHLVSLTAHLKREHLARPLTCEHAVGRCDKNSISNQSQKEHKTAWKKKILDVYFVMSSYIHLREVYQLFCSQPPGGVWGLLALHLRSSPLIPSIYTADGLNKVFRKNCLNDWLTSQLTDSSCSPIKVRNVWKKNVSNALSCLYFRGVQWRVIFTCNYSIFGRIFKKKSYNKPIIWRDSQVRLRLK